MNRKGTKGYYWSKRDNRWIAELLIDGKKIYLESFKQEDLAIKARREAELKYFRDFAYKH